MPTFVVVDVETSGLRPWRDHVLQVGAVTVDGTGDIVDRWVTTVALPHWWSRVGPTHVHGLRRRHLRRAPLAADVMGELARRLDGAVFVAHNADFDAAFVERFARLQGIELSLRPRLCTLAVSRRLDPDRTLSHRLDDLAGRYGVTIERHHDALADATATAEVLPKLLADAGIADETDLTDWFLVERPPRPRRSLPVRTWRRTKRWARRRGLMRPYQRPESSSPGPPSVAER